MTKDIYFAGGCFWGTEHFFKQINGVVATEVGYANGHTENPTYKDVCTDKTGFAETVRVSYDTERVSLRFLIDMYFHAIDPTSLNQQGHDRGTQYRTGIYYTDDSDLPIIDNVYEEKQKECSEEFVVERLPLKNFYTAEYYHAEHWWQIRNGENRFRVDRSYFLSQFPQREDSSYVSGGEGWLLFGPYKELPAGEYTVTYYLGLEEGAELPEDGVLGTVGVNSNAGAFNSADYQKEITAGDLTPRIEHLTVKEDCEDFELQVYASCAGLRVDSIGIRRL